MESSKVTLAQAAGAVGVHINTIKTWRRSGYLKSAELIIEHGVEVWHVKLDEAIQVAEARRKNRVASSRSNGVYPAGYPGSSSTSQGAPTVKVPEQVLPGQVGQISPAFEQSLALIRESVVRPLVEANERQATKIEDLSVQVGTLQEKVRQLEARLAESVVQIPAPSPQPPAAPELEPSPVLSRETLQPVAPPKKRRWWQF
jgi:hypothetical protein